MDDTNDRSARLRQFYARFVTAHGGARDPRIEQAFATVPREPFAGPGPWWVRAAGAGYLQTPDSDPAYLYQNTLVALDHERGINIGEPGSHALWLDALALQPGETVLQVGAGSGYYTAILATLVGSTGRVHAFEIDPVLARRAEANLVGWPWAELHAASGTAADLPKADAVYVNAGITQPSWAWLAAMHPGGRLLFPLHSGRLRLAPPRGGGLAWPARVVSRAGFIACQGLQAPETGRRLALAFAAGGWERVSSIRLDGKPGETCWFSGGDWWRSTDPA